MNKFKLAITGLLPLILLPLSAQSFAQAETLGDCQAIQDRLARYACYDSWDAASGVVRQSVPARSTTTTQAPRAQERAEVRAQEEEDERSLFGRIFRRGSNDAAEEQVASSGTQTPVESFGRAQNSARIIEGSDGKSELLGTVAELEQMGPNIWLITLDGGQVWQQMQSKRYNLQEGDQVRIYPTRWGNNYRLSVEKLGGFIQVRRVN